MAYNLSFNLGYLQCIKKTKEANGDEIVLCGIGMNRLGEMNFIRPRFLGTGIKDGDIIQSNEFTEGSRELFKVDLKDKFKLNYLLVLWIYEHDWHGTTANNWNRLVDRFRETVEDKTARLQQKNYEDNYVFHQAFSESILDLNLLINDTLSDGEGHESQYKHELFLPVLIRFDHKDISSHREIQVTEPKSYENVSLDNNSLFRIGYYNYLSPHSDARYRLSYSWKFKNTNENPILQ